MKTTVPINVLTILCLALLISACDRASELSFDGSGSHTTAHTITDLKRLCTKTTVRITRNITIEGVVVANDTYGEFTKTIVIQDAEGGIPVLVDHTSTGISYPIGIPVTIHCNGLALGRSGDKIQLGAIPTGEYSVDRIAKAELDRYIRTGTSGIFPEAPILSFSEVAAHHIDTYIRFDNIHFVTEGPWCNPNPETLRPEVCEREIADGAGNVFTVRIPGTCSYATEPVPKGTGSICGILDYFNGKYSLRITNRMLVFTAEVPPTTCLSTAGDSFLSPTR